MAVNQYWLMKTEPDVFSIDDLKSRPEKTEPWNGVRNYQARNFIRDLMKKGDLILFYHSNATPPGIVGVAQVVKEAYPDNSSWDKKSEYFDPKSTVEKPIWFMVDVKFVKKFNQIISLEQIKSHQELKEMKVAMKGQRLSVQPVEEKHFKLVCKIAES